ncbi:1151_t:CDS:2 [Paraglomus brasilianum]|uniref:1151_t:CDS:1 n=1 Tax=Paraglomus brasilianum TaxID=144538 RepID=A0A9N9G8E6_9GLOM|nr:1151_t:CDS:2 [Paraglomus brasilianum]
MSYFMKGTKYQPSRQPNANTIGFHRGRHMTLDNRPAGQTPTPNPSPLTLASLSPITTTKRHHYHKQDPDLVRVRPNKMVYASLEPNANTATTKNALRCAETGSQQHFDKSICTREDCPYTHVHVSKGAKICEDFIQGFCEQGEECEMKHLWGRKAQVEMIWQRSEEEKREMNEEVRRKVHEGVERKKKSRDKSKNKKAGKKEKSKQKNENKRGREEESFSNQKGKRVRIDMMSIDNTSDSSSGEDDTAFRDKEDLWRYDFIAFDE